MTRYFLAQDNDTNWWIVPVDRRRDFEAWADCEDYSVWTPPEFAIEVGGCPGMVSFSNPEIEP